MDSLDLRFNIVVKGIYCYYCYTEMIFFKTEAREVQSVSDERKLSLSGGLRRCKKKRYT